MKDLIDDNPIEESEGDSDGSDHHKKRKQSDDEDFDDRLEDEDYDLIEENLGVRLERVSLIGLKGEKRTVALKILRLVIETFQTPSKNSGRRIRGGARKGSG